MIEILSQALLREVEQAKNVRRGRWLLLLFGIVVVYLMLLLFI